MKMLACCFKASVAHECDLLKGFNSFNFIWKSSFKKFPGIRACSPLSCHANRYVYCYVSPFPESHYEVRLVTEL